MKHHPTLIVVLLSLAALSARADVLELKNGQTLSGKYVGGTAATIRFETSGGIQAIETAQALALTFTGGGTATAAPAAAPAPVAAAAAPAAAPPVTSATIPAGTTLLVRMVDPISSRDPQGKRFTTTLETDLAVNGAVVAKAGSKVYGRVQSAQQAGRFAGQSKLDLRLTELALGPNLVPLMTSGYTDAGARSGGKTVKGAAAGAAIGAIAGGGEGAGKGAAIGAVASGIKKGEALSVSPGTLLEFQLQQPLTVNLAK
jgi:hypothetical protein